MIKLKNEKGITLVALIITIIILLILAGVTISLVIGQDGLIAKSKEGASKYNDESDLERINMIVSEAQTKGYEEGNNGELTQENLQEALDNSYGVGNATASEKQADGIFIIKVGEKEYKIDSGLGVSSLNIVQPKNIEDWEYTTDTETNTITINKYKGTDIEVIIPNYIGDVPVKEVSGINEDNNIWDEKLCEEIISGSDRNKVQPTIEKIVISEGVESIGDCAFKNTRNLHEILLPSTLKNIGKAAFQYCFKLTNLVVPNGVTSIEAFTFQYCSDLKSIIIPSSVTEIGWDSFWNCSSLESVTIPDSVVKIDKAAFGYCSNLTNVNISNSITSIGTDIFSNCESLKSITIPDGVTSIESGAFARCSNLTSVTISKNVTNIGEKAFGWCNKLKSITIPNNVVKIEKSAFMDISPDAQIICDFESKPDGWISDWTNCTNIVWKRAQNTST